MGCNVLVLCFISHLFIFRGFRSPKVRERSGSVVECLTRDRGAAGSSLTGVTAHALKTHLS